jgi:hypothetical protein
MAVDVFLSRAVVTVGLHVEYVFMVHVDIPYSVLVSIYIVEL